MDNHRQIPATAPNQRQLALAIGVAPKQVGKWIRDPRWTFTARGPWNVDEVKQWRAATLAPNPADIPATRYEKDSGIGEQLGQAKLAAQVKLLQRKIEHLEQTIAIRQSDLVPRADAEREQIAIANAVRSGLQRTIKALRQPLADADDARETDAMLTEAFRGLCNHAFGAGNNISTHDQSRTTKTQPRKARQAR